MKVTSVERMEWAHHPVTQEFLQGLRDTKQSTMELWAREGYTAATAELTLAANAKALGGVYVLDQAIEIIEGYSAIVPEFKGVEDVRE